MRILLLGDHSAGHCGSQAVWLAARNLLSRKVEIVKNWDDCDAVVLNGEAVMHHGLPSFHENMRQLAHAQARGHKTFLVNTVWQKNPATYDAVLAKLDGLQCRGEMSRASLSEHDASAQTGLDLSYYLAINEDGPTFDWSGRIVATDVWTPGFGWAWLAAPFAKDWVKVDLREISWASFVRSLKTAKLLVTGRNHGMYAAARARIPFIPLRGSYHKFLDVFAENRSPIPICRKESEIIPTLAWAQRNPEVYQKLFDQMEAKTAPNLLETRAKPRKPFALAYAASTLASLADAKGDYASASHLWQKVVETHSDRTFALWRAALAHLRAGNIEDGASALIELRSLDPDRSNLGLPFGAPLKALTYWLKPDRGTFSGKGWAGSAWLAADAARRGDMKKFRRSITRMFKLAMARSPFDYVAARLVLTLRLITEENYQLAELFWDGSCPKERPDWETIEDDFRVLSHTSPYSQRARTAATMLGALLESSALKHRSDLRLALLQHRWLVDPPEVARSEDALAQLETEAKNAEIFEAALSSCLEAGHIETVREIAKQHPSLFASTADKNAPVAAFSIQRGLCEPTVSSRRLMEVMVRSQAVEEELIGRLTDSQRTLAVVGNGPRGADTGIGEQIDARNEVIRFNDFQVAGAWKDISGERTTIVFSVHQIRRCMQQYLTLSPGTIVGFVTQKRAFLERDWHGVAKLEDAGIRVCFPMWDARESLARRLEIYPSTGLMVIDQLVKLRPGFSRRDIFGFNFGPDENGRYAYDSSRTGSGRHIWTLEKIAFDSILPE